MQFNLGNSYTVVTNATPEEEALLHQWCNKEYEYYGLDFSQKPPRRMKMVSKLPYFKYNKFPAGWTGKFLQRLRKDPAKAANSEYVTFKDIRTKPKNGATLMGMTGKLNIPMLRDYQERALKASLKSSRGIIHHATGAGKTVVTAAILSELGLPSLIIVPTLNLLIQTAEDLKGFLGEDYVGEIGEGIFNPKLFTVATVQSLWSKIKRNDEELSKLFKTIDVLCIDEAHHINVAGKNKIQNTYFQIAMMLDCYYKFGLTATPGDPDSLERELLEGATGRAIDHVSSSELIKRGLLTRPEIQMYRIHPPQRYSDWQAAYKQNILRNSRRNAQIVRLAEQYSAQDKSVLITVTRVEEHGGLLNDMIPQAVFMSGKTPAEERKQILEDFGNKKIKVLISTVVNEGVNIPSMDVIIMAGGGKSNKQTVQRVGRALRKSEGKSKAMIIDFYDADNGMLERHSKARLKTYKKESEFEIKAIIDVD